MQSLQREILMDELDKMAKMDEVDKGKTAEWSEAKC